MHYYTKMGGKVSYGASGVVSSFLQLVSGAIVYKESEHCSQLSFSEIIPGDNFFCLVFFGLFSLKQ